MSLLNFDSPGTAPKGGRKSLKIFLGIGLLAGTIAIGSTLAASINLNESGPIEFGQGVTLTSACDEQVKVTPISSFVNSDRSGGYAFSAITLSELDDTNQMDATDEGCAGKSFTIKSYNASGILLTPNYSISIASDGSFSSPDGSTVGKNEDGIDSSVNLTFDSTSINAESVYRITIESTADRGNIFSPAVSTTRQIFTFNPADFIRYPTGDPSPEVGHNVGWMVLKSPNVNSRISLYTFANSYRDTVIYIYNSDRQLIGYDDDNAAMFTDSYARDFLKNLPQPPGGNFSALTFNAEANQTYYFGVTDYGLSDPAPIDVNIGYYYTVD